MYRYFVIDLSKIEPRAAKRQTEVAQKCREFAQNVSDNRRK